MKINFIIISILSLLVISCSDDSNPVSISGCNDALACNYVAGATDDGSCEYSGTCTLSDGTDLSSYYATPSECDNSGSCWDLIVTGSQMSDLNTEALCYADASCSSCSNPVLSSSQDLCLCESGGTWNGTSCDGTAALGNTWTENSLNQVGCEAYVCIMLDGTITSPSSQSECEVNGVCIFADVDGDGSTDTSQPTNFQDCTADNGINDNIGTWIAGEPFWVQSGKWTPSAYYWVEDSSVIWTDTCE